MCPFYHQFHVESLLIPSLYIFHYIHSRRKVKLSGKRNERSNDEKTSLSIPIQKLLIPTKFIQFQFSLPFPDVYISFLLFGNIVVSVQMSRFLYQNLIILKLNYNILNFCLRLPSSLPVFCSFLNSFRNFFIDIFEHFLIRLSMSRLTIAIVDPSRLTMKIFIFEILIASIGFINETRERK